MPGAPANPSATPYTIPGIGVLDPKAWTPEQWTQVEALAQALQNSYAQLAKPQNALFDANGNVISSVLGNAELIAHKDIANGYPGLDAGALLKLAEWPFHFGWIDYTDNAGVITTNSTGGTQIATVGFRSGTIAGDMQLTLPTAMHNAWWGIAGVVNKSAAIGKLAINGDNPLHSTTQLNFYTAGAADALIRAAECFIVFVGPK